MNESSAILLSGMFAGIVMTGIVYIVILLAVALSFHAMYLLYFYLYSEGYNEVQS